MAPPERLTRTFVRDTIQSAFHLVQTRWLVPSKLNHVWRFQGKSLPAVKSRSASLTVQTVNGRGSVEAHKSAHTRLTAGLPSGFVRLYWLRTVGHTGTGLLRKTQRFWTVDL